MNIILIEEQEIPTVVSWCGICQTYTRQDIIKNGNGVCSCGTENDKTNFMFQVTLKEIV